MVLFGTVIIRYGYYLCDVLRYGAITAVLLGTVIIHAAFFDTVISLRCYSVQLLFLRRSLVQRYRCDVIRYGSLAVFLLFGRLLQYCDITAVLFGTVVIRAVFLGTVISLWYYSVQLLLVRRSSVG